MAEWTTCGTFTDLLESNKKFLRGEISSTPYHYGPIETETCNLVPSLLKLHERRIFTWSSQPYLRQRTSGDGGRFYQTWQRPYVSFIVAEKSNPRRLFQELKRKKEIKVYARKVYSPEAALKGSFTQSKVVTKSRMITRYRRLLLQQRWKCLTSVDPASDVEKEDIFSLEAMKQAKPWIFDVVAASWKEIDIARIIVEAVDAAQV